MRPVRDPRPPWDAARMITRMRRMSVLFITALAAHAPLATALHEVDHRVTIRGAIYQPEGTPHGHSAVSVVEPGGAVLATTNTGRTGKFQFVLHLHDEDAGRMLILRSGPLTREFRLTFDPNDTRTERIVRVSIGEPSPEVRRRALVRTGGGIAVLAALAAAGALLIARKAGRRGKGKRKRRTAGAGKKRGRPRQAAGVGPRSAASGRAGDRRPSKSRSRRR